MWRISLKTFTVSHILLSFDEIIACYIKIKRQLYGCLRKYIQKEIFLLILGNRLGTCCLLVEWDGTPLFNDITKLNWPKDDNNDNNILSNVVK